MNLMDQLLADITIPRFVKVRYEMDGSHIEDVEGAVREALNRKGTLDRIRPGDRVCITSGSREVVNVARITRAVCDIVKEAGGKPFIIPAMGSHAGADAEGQKGILAGYGVTEEAMGAPVLSSMETEVIGYAPDGQEVHMDKYANGADFIIPIGRVKAHTDFRGPVESGICKMLVIGMGKQHGAYQCHKMGFPNMAKNVMAFAKVIIEKKPNMFALGLVENAYHQTCRIEAVPAKQILEEEPEILKYSKERMGKIPFEKADILLVDEAGKNISGAGMDPNVTGRSPLLPVEPPYFQRIAVFDLTDCSHGNIGGVGNADVTTMRLYNKVDLEQTYANGITSAVPESVKIPVVMPAERTAIKFAMRTATETDWEKGCRIVWIRNTLSLSEFYISEALISEAEAVPGMTISSELLEPQFDEAGNFTGF
ncbi:MAG: DUF2088 domain-containing protein [Lachnospiraceae bacterium]|jgi:hypothetical protein|nr:DUF2088 domain-containing protein [Lachnospiraceae bacterium]